MYTVKPGEMAEWLGEWREKVVPLRRHFGFEVVGAWTVEAEDRFVWILSHSGPQAWDEADRGYYESAERKALDPDPARHLAKTEHWLMHRAGE
jgi:NIPSNAP